MSMSTLPSRTDAGLDRTLPSQAVAGYLAAVAIFAGLTALVYYPGRIGPAAIFTALLAAALGRSLGRFTGVAFAVATLGWLGGMVVAVVLGRPLL